MLSHLGVYPHFHRKHTRICYILFCLSMIYFDPEEIIALIICTDYNNYNFLSVTFLDVGYKMPHLIIPMNKIAKLNTSWHASW